MTRTTETKDVTEPSITRRIEKWFDGQFGPNAWSDRGALGRRFITSAIRVAMKNGVPKSAVEMILDLEYERSSENLDSLDGRLPLQVQTDTLILLQMVMRGHGYGIQQAQEWHLEGRPSWY